MERGLHALYCLDNQQSPEIHNNKNHDQCMVTVAETDYVVCLDNTVYTSVMTPNPNPTLAAVMKFLPGIMNAT